MEGNEIFTFIASQDIENVKKILSEKKLKGDLYDDHGMTPLQHAAYKGDKQMCQLLLDHGADVNSGCHEHGYSALHFAALSGKDEVCTCLLAAGAKSYATNSVGRTASQMAAFVGNHKCVAVINNYIPKSVVDYYTVPNGFETSPKLDPILAQPLHEFIMKVNIHPVRIALNLLPNLISNLSQIRKVLDLMSEKQMKNGSESNEIMSFKLHYLSYVIGEVAKCKQGDKECDLVELFARKIHRPIRGDEYIGRFIRDCVREFHYRECMVFKQMVSSLTRNDVQSIQALNVINTAINGHRGFIDDKFPCHTCGEDNAPKKCSKCKIVKYCNRECQRLHWFIHKKECTRSTSTIITNTTANITNTTANTTNTTANTINTTANITNTTANTTNTTANITNTTANTTNTTANITNTTANTTNTTANTINTIANSTNTTTNITNTTADTTTTSSNTIIMSTTANISNTSTIIDSPPSTTVNTSNSPNTSITMTPTPSTINAIEENKNNIVQVSNNDQNKETIKKTNSDIDQDEITKQVANLICS